MTNNAGKIVEGHEPLLSKILLLLPPKSIFRFLSVSKRWNNMIHDSFFLDNYSRGRDRDRLLAFIQKEHIISLNCLGRTTHRPINILPWNNNIKYTPWKSGYFLNSSNGLVLSFFPSTSKFAILNPVTKNQVVLPRPPRIRKRTKVLEVAGLTCWENKTRLAPNYVVVVPYTKQDFVEECILKIASYSSRSGAWTKSTLVSTGYFSLCTMVPTVSNGVFHWFGYMFRMDRDDDPIDHKFCIAVYDPKDSRNHLQLIVVPVTWIEYSNPFVLSRCPDNGMLWYARSECSLRIKFWMLPKSGDGYMRSTTIPSDEWVLVYNIDFESVSKSLLTGGTDDFCLEDIVCWGPLIVLVKKGEGWFLYNVESKEVELVRLDDPIVPCPSYIPPHLSPFMESSCLSSYALCVGFRGT